jgi:hypothetical protein
MKNLTATIPLALLLAASPALVWAQAPAAKADAKAAPKPAGKTATKPAGKPAANTAKVGTSKASRAAQKAAEESRTIDDDPAVKLTAADLEAAKQVTLGDIPCELGATVHITQHKREGFFIVRTGIQRFRMHPVESRTGAIRLEDPVAGAMWLQLGNKSMLMSQKMGKRLADDCMNPAQSAMNEQLKKDPINIFEKPPVVKVVAPAQEATAPASTPATREAQEPPAAAPATPVTAPAEAAPAAK